MKTPASLNALLTISALLLVAGGAAADPIHVGSYATLDAQATAQAHTDAVVDDAHKLVGTVQATADDATAHAKAEASADASASTGILASVKAGVASNLGALKGWFLGLFGHAKGAANVDAKGALGEAQDAANGKIDAKGGIDASSHLDAKALAPPQPDVGFLGDAQGEASGILRVG